MSGVMSVWVRSSTAAIVRVCVAALRVAWIAGLVAAFLAVGWWMNSFIGVPGSWPVTWVALVLLGAAVTAIGRRRAARSRPVTDGVELPESSHPALWAEVRSLTSQLQVAAPGKVYLGLDPSAVGGFVKTGRRGRRRRALVVGVAPLWVLSMGEWRAALASQMWSESGGTGWERTLVRGQRKMSRLAEVAISPTWLAYCRSPLLKLHMRLARPACQRRQLEADATGAAVSSAEVARLALLSLPAARAAWERFWTVHVAPGLSVLRRPIDLVAGFEEYLSTVGIPDLPPTAPAFTASLPGFLSLEERVAALGGTPSPLPASPHEARTEDELPAATLLGDRQCLVQLELAWFDKSGLTPVDWDALAQAAASHHTRRRAGWFADQVARHIGDPNAATRYRQAPAVNLGFLLDDLAENEGRTLHEAVAGSVADASGEDEGWLVGTFLGDVIAAGLLETVGAHYVNNWAVAATLVLPDGAVVDPWAAATDADFGSSRSALRLRSWCRDVGLPTTFRPLPVGPDLGRTVTDSDPVVLCASCFYTNWRARYVFVLDTGIIIVRPRLSDLLLGGMAANGGDPGATMLRRWLDRTGAELLAIKRGSYTDWADIRSVRWSTPSRRRLLFAMERVDGTSVTVKGNRNSRFQGQFAVSISRFLGDRLVIEPMPTPDHRKTKQAHSQ